MNGFQRVVARPLIHAGTDPGRPSEPPPIQMMNNPTIRLPMLMRFPSPRLDLGRGIGGAGDCREFKQRRPADRPQDAVAAPLDAFAAQIDTEARRQAPDQPARVSRQKVARPGRAIRNRRLDHQRAVLTVQLTSFCLFCFL